MHRFCNPETNVHRRFESYRQLQLTSNSLEFTHRPSGGGRAPDKRDGGRFDSYSVDHFPYAGLREVMGFQILFWWVQLPHGVPIHHSS